MPFPRRLPPLRRPGRAGRAVPAPWVRTRLRAAPGTAAALALLVALTACLAAVLPRAVDRYEDAGLARSLSEARPDRTTVQVYAPPQPAPTFEEAARALLPGALAAQDAKILGQVRRPLAADPDQSAYGVRTTVALTAVDTGLPRPGGLAPRLHLVAQQGLAAHARTTAGRPPRARGAVTADTAGLEAAVTAGTAAALHLRPGSVVHVATGLERTPLTVRITGVLAPRSPGGAYWSTDPLLRTPALTATPGGGPNADRYWLGTLLLAPEAAPALLGTTGRPVRYWNLAPSLGALHGRDLGGLETGVAALESGPGLRAVRTLAGPGAEVTTELDSVLGSYARLRSGVRPLVGVAAVGTGTVAAVVLVLAGGLTADRRRAELALLRARGASPAGTAGRLLAETATVAVPAGAAGLAAALWAVPGGRTAAAVAAAAAVTAVACLALPLRAAAAHLRVRVAGARRDLADVRPSRRRTVAELTLLALAVAAVVSLRGPGAGGGPLVPAAPVLLGVIASLVLVRLHPLPLRRLAGPVRRLRGVVTPLALARAGRTPASAALPLLALLTALTTAAFGGSVLAGVHAARDRAALMSVGADARIEAPSALPASLPDRIRHVPGVRGVTEVALVQDAQPTDGRVTLPVAGVDPGPYAALARHTRLGAFPAGALAPGRGAAAPLPALASPMVADMYGSGPFSVRLPDGSTISVRIAAVRDRTPAVPGTDFLVVDRAGLDRTAARPTALLLTGDHPDAAALRRAAPEDGGVQLRDEERARYVDSPLQSGAEDVYTAAVAAGAVYAALALLLALSGAAPERAAMLARLRTMGLTRAQARRLLVLESLPQALPAAVGGILTGWAAVRLLAPGVDLAALALGTAPGSSDRAPVLRTDPLSLAAPALCLLVLAVAVAGVQAWRAGRRGSVRELRAGDAR
ncbi:FtsX-like permease family protein [Streptomyces sp. MS06]|uniref:FtsX-like permease family protein n=1 Tax=Streptomyces sp. MS06 TaxID=3385974 RepID=UPI0039A12701